MLNNFEASKKVISFHSSRGGTGKTVIAVNVSAILAHKGLNLALIDLDFRAPSLHHIFSEIVKEPIKFWVNDYLDSRCGPADFLFDVHKVLNLKGNLFIGFANPSLKVTEYMLRRSMIWEAKALKRLRNLRNFLFEDLGMDFCIYDTSPGIQYSSLNAIICSDLIVFIVTSDPLDLEGLNETLKEFNDIFENRTLIILNKSYPETDNWSSDRQREYVDQLTKYLKSPIIEIIACHCAVLKAKRSQPFVLETPNHPFSKKLEEIVQSLLKGGMRQQ